jgi:hypothetical protein
VTIAARTTPKGKRLLKKVRKSIRARLIIDVPGAARGRTQITLKR